MKTTGDLFVTKQQDDSQHRSRIARTPTKKDLIDDEEKGADQGGLKRTAVMMWKNRILLVGIALVISRLSGIHHETHVTLHCSTVESAKDQKLTKNLDIVRLSIDHLENEESDTDIKAAVCFKTLFGSIDIGLVIQWAGKS